MGDLSSIFDIFLAGCGVYLIYCAYLMKARDEIKTQVLFSNAIKIEQCKDRNGYCRYMYPRLTAVGVIVLICGVLSLVNTYLVPLGGFGWVLQLLALAALVWYSRVAIQSVKRFWHR